MDTHEVDPDREQGQEQSAISPAATQGDMYKWNSCVRPYPGVGAWEWELGCSAL